MIDILSLEFMRNSLIAAMLVGASAPLVGVFLVQRGMSLIGDGMGHVALAGVGVGVLTSSSPVLTALAVVIVAAVAVELLRHHGVGLAGKHVLVIGRGVTIGRPAGLVFTRREVNATVTLAHTGTTNLDELLASADVVIAAAGSAHMVKPEQVKEGVIVLDVGVSRVTGEDGTSRVLGDVDPAVKEKAAWMAPNPGGVGPMTRVMLLANVVEAAERAADGEDWAGERAGA